MVVNNNTAYFYERTVDSSGFIPSLLTWQIINNRYYLTAKLLDTDDLYLVYPNLSEYGQIRRPYIVLKGNGIARNATAKLQATSSIIDNPKAPSVQCNFAFSIMGFAAPAVGIYPSSNSPNINYKTFDGLNETFPVDA